MIADSSQLIEHEPVSPDVLAGRFELSEVLARDQFGAVYLANDVSHQGALKSLCVTVAVRILGHELSAETRESIIAEASKSIELRHRSVARIFECAKAEGETFFTFESLRGVELDRRLSTKRLKPFQAIRVLRELADAFQYLQSNGIVFEAINPRAILLEPAGGIKILPIPALHSLDSGAVRGTSPLNTFGSFAHLVVYGSLPRASGERRKGLLALLGRDPSPRELTAVVESCLKADSSLTLEAIATKLISIERTFPDGSAGVDPVVQELMETKPEEPTERHRNGTLFVLFLGLYLAGILLLIGFFSRTSSIFFR